MMNDIVSKLATLFERLPGIGPRQARRFVYALLDENDENVRALSAALLELKNSARRCEECFRASNAAEKICAPCRTHAASPALLVVERDVDLENLEKLGIYDGLTFILGGTISPLGEGTGSVRLRELFEKIKRSPQLVELIIATSATNEGDLTAAYIAKVLEEFVKLGKLKITRLARGLSTGTQLEFSDRTTLEQALKNRR